MNNIENNTGKINEAENKEQADKTGTGMAEKEGEYTFVRETIKKKPPLIVRGLLKGLKFLILGIIFGLGVSVVLWIMGMDVRDFFDKDNKENGDKITTSVVQTEYTEAATESETESINVEEKINSQLVDIIAIYYEEDEENEGNEETETTDTTGETEVTANISDNKEMQSSVTEEITTQEQSSEENEILGEEETTEPESASEETEAARIGQKQYYTGVIINNTSDVFVCVDKDKIEGAGKLYVKFYSSDNEIEAKISGVDDINNLAILKVAASDVDIYVKQSIKSVNVVKTDKIENGSKILYVGNPYGIGRLYYTGTVAAVDNGHAGYDMFYYGIITDINSRDISDGFMFDEKGDLVAMVGNISGEQSSGNNISGINMEDIMSIVRSLMYNTKRWHIGIKGDTVTNDMRDLAGEQIPDGMYVTGVARDSTAFKSGIMVGDIITEANEKTVKSLKDIQNILEKSKENDTITLVLKRKIGTGYNELTIRVPVDSNTLNIE